MLFCLCQETWAANLTLNKKYLWYTGIIKTQRDKFFKTDNTLLTISVVQFLFLRSEKISMKQVEAKDIVTMTYTGRLDDGTVFKTAQAEKPMKLELGKQEAPPTLEAALIGMKIGEKKQVRIDPDESYGQRMKNLIQELHRKQIGDKIDPKPGMIISLAVEKDGHTHQVPATVIEVKGDSITIDYNHPLAGHHLTYSLEVIDIKKPF